MISPQVYQQQINDLEIDGMEISPKNCLQADTLLKKLLKVENYLEQIRYNIRMDIRIIRRDYMDKIREIENSDHKLREKKELFNQRELKIVPYQSTEDLVDDYLRQIKLAKKYLETYLKTHSE